MQLTLKPKRPWCAYQFQLRLLLLPFLAGMVLLVALPALATLLIAFTEYNAVRAPMWVGLENFRRLLTSPLVRLSLRNSIVFLLLAVPLRVLGALLLALLLQRGRRFFGVYRTAVFLPTIIPEVAYALIWLWLFNPLYGPLNMLLGWLGLPAPGWLVEPDTAVLAIVIMLCFQLGEGFLILLVGLKSVPGSYYEAATVDGASVWQRFRFITLPLLVPWLLLFTFRDLMISLQSTFTPSFVLTYGGPDYATTFMPLLLYELAFDFFDLGLAAALLVVTYLLFGAVVWGIVRLVRDGRLSTDG